MNLRRALRRTPAALGAALLVSACSQTADEPSDAPELGDDSSSSVEPADPDPSPADAGIPLDHPEVGLAFGSLPEANGSRRAALETYVAYERGLRELSRTGRLDPGMADLATEPVLRTLRATVAYLRNNDTRYRGTASIDVSVDGGNDQVVVLDLCTDASDLRLVSNGVKRPVEGLKRAQGRVTLNAVGGSTWTVTDYTTLEEPC